MGYYVYAWRSMPDEYAIKNSGAHQGGVISFKTKAAFVSDTGINDPRVKRYRPVKTAGPIKVWDVQIVK